MLTTVSDLPSALPPGNDTALLPYVGKARLKPAAQLGEAEIDGEINHCTYDIERHRLVYASDDLLDRHHQVDDADKRDERAPLYRVGDIVDPRREEAAKRLRKDDIEHPRPKSQSNGLSGLDLAEVNRLERAAGDLGHLCRRKGGQSHDG